MRYQDSNSDLHNQTRRDRCLYSHSSCLQTAEEYLLEYDSRRGPEYSRFHGYTYDGVWAVALAIQHVAHRIRHIRHNQTMVDFRYRDPLWEDLFLDALKNTSFEGVTRNLHSTEFDVISVVLAQCPSFVHSVLMNTSLDGPHAKEPMFSRQSRHVEKWSIGHVGSRRDRFLVSDSDVFLNLWSGRETLHCGLNKSKQTLHRPLRDISLLEP
uniref:Receptor ligand binding region domain-containing protein n=1 Tax=Timema genevievae TaxID=629358 RepID=A0A7R9PMR7_TIMGE|nr:unnamed protein product [Timema genevievae]